MDLDAAIAALEMRVKAWKEGRTELPEALKLIEIHLEWARKSFEDGACGHALGFFRDAESSAKDLGI